MYSGSVHRSARACILLAVALMFAINAANAFAATVPGAPTGVSASPAGSQALVSWTAPSSDGGSAITSYTITVTPSGGSSSQVTVNNGSATSAVVTGLTNNTSYTFTVAATNSVGTGAASTASAAVTPQNTIYDFSGTPQLVDTGDTASETNGVQFTSDTAGTVTGIRFYKASTNTGTHIGSLWTASGQLLASATFTNETASGWQTVTFANPVSISAGTTYVASYFDPNGHESATPQGAASQVNNPPLHALANGGVWSYGSSNTFPTSTYNGNNYWVDVLFNPSTGGGTATAPGAPTGVTATPASSQALVSWTPPSSNGGAPITSYTITVTPSGGSSSQVTVNNGSATSAVVTGLTNDTGYTFKVAATNSVGTGTASSASPAATPEDTVFDFTTPQTSDSGDTAAVNLGVEFTPSVNGAITGVRFYKASTNTGAHVGSLWTTSGGLLAQGTFTGESPSGWQTLVFSNPVSVTAGTTYIASYLAPNGHFSMTRPGFANAVTNGPLTAPASSSTALGNGVYAYGSSTTFPTNSYQATDYGVDVLFNPGGTGGGGTATAPGAPTGVTAAPASSRALVSWSAPASDGGAPITSYTVTPYIGSTAQTPVQVNNGSATSATVTGLTNGTAYTFKVAATNSVGTGTASSASPAATPEDTIFDFTTPQTADSGDGSSINLGIEFTASQTGSVTGVRFFKSSANTGNHVGSLWSASGQLLAQGTFTGESSSGWQTLVFPTPVAITSGTTYIASYLAPNGHFSMTRPGFSTAVTNGPLTAPASDTTTYGNGVFAYSSSSTFPTNSYQATDYGVDVLFSPGAPSSPPGQPTGVSATAGTQAATVSWTAPSSGGVVYNYTITPYIGSTAQQVTTVSGTNTSTTVTGLFPNQAYTFVVTASNPAGNGPASAPSNSVTPTAPMAPTIPQNVTAAPASSEAQVSWTAPSSDGGSSITGYTITPYIGSSAQTATHVNGSATSAVVTGLSDGTTYTFTVTATNNVGTSPTATTGAVTPENTIYDFSGTPLLVDSGDNTPETAGVKFTSDGNGSVTGIRFYKATTNTGTHIGSLWSSTGQLLAQATFTNETASGWQTVTFSSPVTVTPGATYVASYLAPNGHESATPQGLTNEFDNPPLHALANGGVYSYGSTPTFPTSTYNANNYWVDVMFQPAADAPPGVPTNVSATPGYQSATVNWTDPGQGGSAITSYTVTPYIGSTAQTPTTINGASVHSAMINGLTNGTSYTFKVSATNANGAGSQSSASNAVTPGPQPQGLWSSLMNWPLVAVHSTLLSTGKVLVWDAWQQPEPTQEWDPSTNTFTNAINSPDSIFCGAMAQMPNGNIIVAGGYGQLSTGNLGINDTTIYNPSTGTWTRMANMHYDRWYPSLTELADGRYVAISGNTTDSDNFADIPEVYDPNTNTWTALSSVNTSQVHELMYPNSYLIPNGNVFVLGEQEDVSYELNVDNQTWTQVGGSSGVVNGASIMYRPGKVLYAGGATSLTTSSPPLKNAATIDLTSSSPQWQSTASMSYGRVLQNMTMLADGTVLATGGQQASAGVDGQYQMSGGVLPAEIWNPSTGQWTTVASMAATRGYHTSTLLLPSGQVLVAGSGHGAPGYPGQDTAQIYSPPYLFNGPRPTISSAPSTATYGSQVTISTPDASSISQVNLVDLGTSTHQMDFAQHFVPLSFTKGSGQLTVTMPANGNYAPPANYMLFIVNSNGTPSVASFVNLGASQQAPAQAQAVTASALSSSSALVTWRAAPSTGSAVTSYTVTPYDGSTALAPTTVTGSPAPTRATISGLRPDVAYRFTVTAKNGKGTGHPSSRSKALTLHGNPVPQLVQKASAYADTTSAVPLRLPFRPAGGDRVVVQASVWGGNARAAQVTDSAGNHFTELVHAFAPDGTEMSVWTAPVKPGQRSKDTVTVAPTRQADVGAVALEYSGLSAAPGSAAVDRIAVASGATATHAAVSSGAVGPTSAEHELALGLYADSGFGNRLQSAAGWRQRFNLSPSTKMMEQVVQDRIVPASSEPNASVVTGAKTPWLMATVAFLPAGAHARPATSQSGAAGTAPPARSATSYQGVLAPQTGPAVPLSSRKRPHLVAGGIAAAFERGPDGKLVRFYCLVSSSGKLLLDQRVNPKSVWWLPAAMLK
jgi:Domain of unknown function (DUF4082)/Domain of unknown function (DUF1929)/Fibronectin type III domain/Glyoxal oxidase N-terminus